jgi:hypothetical protein
MAQGVGGTHPILGLQQTFGGMFWSPLDINGSASYVQGGDAISPQSFGFNSYIHQLVGGVSQSGNYVAVPRALNSGFTQWQLVWFVVATGLQVGAAVNLSGETVRLAAIGQ